MALSTPQNYERDQDAGLEIAPLDTKGAHPYVEHDKAGLRDLPRHQCKQK